MDRKQLERSVRRHLAALDSVIGPASYRGENLERRRRWAWVRRMAGAKGDDESWAMAIATARDPDEWHDMGRGEGHDVRELFQRLANIAEQSAATKSRPRLAAGPAEAE